LDLDGEGARTLADDLASEFGVTAEGHTLDVTDSTAVDEVAAQITASDLPPVGALANIAGIPSPVPFLEVSNDLWDRIIAVNLTGTFYTCRAFLPAMLEGGYGRIVNMSSVSAQQAAACSPRPRTPPRRRACWA